MKSPDDPLFRILADEVADLPGRAAAEARQRRTQRRRNRIRLAQVTAIALGSVIVWSLLQKQTTPPDTIGKQLPDVTAPNPTGLDPIAPDPVVPDHHEPYEPAPGAQIEPDAPIPNPFAINEKSPTEDKGSNIARPLPSGLDEEQTKFVLSVGDIPLLFVRDASGKVTRIHIVQR